MNKRKLSYNSVEIPFKIKFSHASAIREKTESIIVQIEANGIIGLGESCPRAYVTNETIDSAYLFISKIKPQVENISTLDELTLLKNILENEINSNPGAWCAVELALIDLLAREKKMSAEALLNIASKPNNHKHTAVIGITSLMSFLFKILVYKTLGFDDFKIKLSGKFKKDKIFIILLSFFTKKIRVDANNFFQSIHQAKNYLAPLAPYLWAIEEPLQSKSFSEMQELATFLKLKIVLDESFINKDSLKHIRSKPDLYIINIRISKMGGILRTIELINILEENNFQWILGSHVGEMSLLTRSSILIQNHSTDKLIAIEGGFSTYLLQYDPYYPNLKLQKGAVLNKVLFDEMEGFGMSYLEEKQKGKK